MFKFGALDRPRAPIFSSPLPVLTVTSNLTSVAQFAARSCSNMVSARLVRAVWQFVSNASASSEIPLSVNGRLSGRPLQSVGGSTLSKAWSLTRCRLSVTCVASSRRSVQALFSLSLVISSNAVISAVRPTR